MPPICIYPGCGLKCKRYNPESFHGLPFRYNDPELIQQWLVVLNIDITTPVETLRNTHYRVCSRHFDKDDFLYPRRAKDPKNPKKMLLKRNAVPRVESPAADIGEESGEIDAACQKPKSQDEMTTTNQSENRDIQEDEDEEFITTLSVGDGRHLVDLGSSSEFIVDEKCILQLFRSCRVCNKQCRVRKHVTGLKIVVNQVCCFCESSFEWTNLPDDDDSDCQINRKNPARGWTKSAKQ